MSKNISNQIKQFTEALHAKQTLLAQKKKAVTGQWKTTNQFNLGNRTVAIRLIKDSNTLVATLALVMLDKTSQEQAATALGIESFHYTLQGYAFEDILHDFKIIQNQIELAELERNVARIESIIKTYTPEELKRERAFEEAQSLLDQIQ